VNRALGPLARPESPQTGQRENAARTAPFLALRKQPDPGQRFAKGSANHPGDAYDLFGV